MNSDCTNCVSVIVPVYNAASTLRVCLEAARRAQPFEIIVVDDGSTDETPAIAQNLGAKVLKIPGRTGPAAARNVGAREATGSVLFFVDADVQMYEGTIDRVWDTFKHNESVDAVIGSYDDSPADADFLSQYKNLMHCFVHQHGHTEASTFWSGCGAIRRDVFFTHSGFSSDYGRPAIEDIELGYRLKQAGRIIVLDRNLRVKHLKRWTFWGLVKTDILDRGIPWSELILRDRKMPNDLNLELNQRVSVALVFVLIAAAVLLALRGGAYMLIPAYIAVFLLLSRYWIDDSRVRSPSATVFMYGLLGGICLICYHQHFIALIPLTLVSLMLITARHRYASRRWTRILAGVAWSALSLASILVYMPLHPLMLLLIALTLAIIVLNNQFYVFLAGKRGPTFALAAIPFHLLYHLYNGISFGIGAARWIWSSLRRPAAQPHEEN